MDITAQLAFSFHCGFMYYYFMTLICTDSYTLQSARLSMIVGILVFVKCPHFSSVPNVTCPFWYFSIHAASKP